VTPLGLELVPQVLRLQSEPFQAVLASGHGFRLMFAVVFLAGVSQALGQSVVLFANRVRPRRFVASLILGAALYVLGFFLLMTSIWLVARYGFDRAQPLGTVFRVAGLAYAPYLFSFFVLTPYLGSFIAVGLSLWSLAAILVALQVLFGMTLLQALLCSAIGWLLLQLLQRTVGRPVQRFAVATRSFVAGQRLELSRQQLEDLLRRPRRRD
jgi:hypothetical protein